MKIAHLADIHIRIAQRIEEYNIIFDRLYQDLRVEKPDLIYVAGDLFHSKLNLSPESVNTAFDFMENLTSIAETIVILGNHDTSLNSTTRMDALQPLERINKTSKNKLHLWIQSGVKKDILHGVDFYHYSCFDELDPLKNSEVDDSKINIAFHHGTVRGSTNDYGYTFDESERTIPYTNFELVLLGDIHKVQLVPRTTNVYYAGSLICQNFSEDFEKHGYYIHEIKSKNDIVSTYKTIPNEFAFVTLNVLGGKLDTSKDIKPTNRVRVRYGDSDSLQDIKLQYYNAYGEYSKVKFQKESIIDKKIKSIESDDIDKIDLTQPKQQEKYINIFFKDESEELRDRIVDLNANLFKTVNTDVMDKHISDWSLESMSFDNSFSYGEGNKVDFTKYRGVIGLFGRNATGKSSFLDTIPFLAYGSFPKMSGASDFVNNRSNSAQGELKLNIDGVTSIINRTVKTKKDGKSSTKLSFSFGDRNLTEGVSETKEHIRKYIGKIDDYLRTAYISQNLPDLFLDMKNSERKEWLASNLNLSFFEKLHEKAKLESKEMKYEISVGKKIDWDEQSRLFYSELNTIKDALIEKEEKIKRINKSIEDVESTIQIDFNKVDELRKKIIYVGESRKEIEEKIEKIEKIISQKPEYENKLKVSVHRLKSKGYETPEKIEKIIQETEEEKKRFSSNFVYNELKNTKERIENNKRKGVQIKSLYDSISSEMMEYDEESMKNDKMSNLNIINEYNLLSSKRDELLYKISEKEKNVKILDEDSRFTTEELCKTCPLLSNAFKNSELLLEFRKELDIVLGKIELIDIESVKNYVDNIEKNFEKLSKLKRDYEFHFKSLIELKKSISEEKKRLPQLEVDAKEAYDKGLADLQYKKDVRVNEIKMDEKMAKKSLEDEINSVNSILGKIQESSSLLDSLRNKIKILDKNKKIEVEISNLESVLIDNRNDVRNMNMWLKEHNSEKNELVTKKELVAYKIADLEKKHKTFTELENEYLVYEKYIEATHKNNLPSLIINMVLGDICDEVNSVLSNMTDYMVKMSIEGDNLDVMVHHPEKGALNSSRLSGMENFMINLAIRIALRKLSNSPSPKFLIVDEGFSSLDKEMVQDLPILFDYLKTEYDFVLIVSHNEYMVDFVDHNFEIQKDEEGRSKIMQI